MELYTYDMDIKALWCTKKVSRIDGLELSPIEAEQVRQSSETVSRSPGKGRGRRISVLGHSLIRDSSGGEELRSTSTSFGSSSQSTAAALKAAAEASGSGYFELDAMEDSARPAELILPTGPAHYSPNVWLHEDMRLIRQPYTSVVFQTFNSGLQKYYEKDWTGARQQFEAILERFEDGPSLYFLKQMKNYGWKPPPDFQSHGAA